MSKDIKFDDIYKEYKNLVYNLSLQYVQNTSDAEDITQEIFVKVYQHMDKYDASLASFKTWIYCKLIQQYL